MPTYTVFPVKPPVSPSQLTAYKTLRLTLLQTDPQAFSSTHAREVAFSEDVWRERLDGPFKQTFVASVLNDVSHESKGVSEDVEEMDEWIGMVSIIGPSGMLPSVLDPFKEAGVGDEWETYALSSMWVHPAHRGKGIGVRLVKACLEWARTNVDPKFSDENNGGFEKVVVLLVRDNNVAGRALYFRAGFADVEGVSSIREGETWMSVKV